MIMSTVVVVCTRFMNKEQASKVFSGYHAVSAVLFALNPEKPLLDTFPNLSGESLSMGLLQMEVICLYSFSLAILSFYRDVYPAQSIAIVVLMADLLIYR